MTTAKTILDWNNYDEEFSGEITSEALTIEINDDESVTVTTVCGWDEQTETFYDSDVAMEYISREWTDGYIKDMALETIGNVR